MNILLLPVVLSLCVQSACCQQEKPDIKSLVSDLQSPQIDKRMDAVWQLSQLGQDAVGATDGLIKALDDPNADIRATAAVALGRIGKPAERAVPKLLQLFADDSPTDWQIPVWAAAAIAVGKMGPKYYAQVAPMLDDPDPVVRRAACGALCEYGQAARPSVPKLLKLVETDVAPVRWGALYALIGIGAEPQQALPVYMKALNSDDFHTQYWACRAIGSLGAAGQPATPKLVKLTKDGVASVRRNAALALGQIGPAIGEEGTAALISALDDRAAAVRESAIVALTQLGPAARTAIPRLRQLLESTQRIERPLVIAALWRIEGPDSQLLELLAEDMDVPDHDLTALGVASKLGSDAAPLVPKLIEKLSSEDPDIRYLAAVALGNVGPEAQPAVQRLQALADDPDPMVRAAAQQALSKITAGTTKQSH